MATALLQEEEVFLEKVGNLTQEILLKVLKELKEKHLSKEEQPGMPLAREQPSRELLEEGLMMVGLTIELKEEEQTEE